jgi:hypothetical protein
VSAAAAVRRTEQPCWRRSYDVDDPRAQVSRPIGDGTEAGALAFIDSFILTMKQWARLTKKRGKPHELSHNMVEIAETLLRRCTSFKTGECRPCLGTIMKLTGFARPTVVRALAKLRQLGFLDWVRRTVKTGNRPGEGPTVLQTSNAYFFDVTKLPMEALRGLRQLLGRQGHQVAEVPRQGSGPVPPKPKRTIRKLVLSAIGSAVQPYRPLSDAEITRRQAEMRAEWERALAAPSQGQSASSDPSLQCPLKAQREEESGR